MHRLKVVLIFLAVLIFQLPGFLYAADLVVPSSRVTTYLNVRQNQTASSPVIGTLQSGKSAILVESVPYWYHVELDNGIRGYVSKSWSEIIAVSEKSIEYVRIGHWNIKKLGHGSSTNFALLAKMIDSSFDIIAIVEVMQKDHGHPGYDKLLDQLGSEWAGVITDTPRPNIDAGHAEHYAVAYRRKYVHTCAGWDHLVYHHDNDGGPDGVGIDYFSREPAFGCFEAGVEGNVGMDFMLAAYHARWEKGNTSLIQKEVAHLTGVFESMRLSKPGEKDLFITGDFNLVPEKLLEVLDFNVVTNVSGSTLNIKGQRTANLYDHFIVYDPESSKEISGQPTVLDLTDWTPTGQIFFKTLSDHLPVVARLKIDGVDDD